MDFGSAAGLDLEDTAGFLLPNENIVTNADLNPLVLTRRYYVSKKYLEKKPEMKNRLFAVMIL